MIVFDTINKDIRFWKISPGYEGSKWGFFYEYGCVALGSWFELTDNTINEGDLRGYRSEDELKEVFAKQAKYLHEHGIREEKGTTSTKYFWRFLKDVNAGDVVFAYSKKQLFGVALVAGDYEFRSDIDEIYPHYRKVNWIIFKPPIKNEGPYEVDELTRNLAFYELEDPWTIRKIEQLIKADLSP